MARTIGKVKIRKLRSIVRGAMTDKNRHPMRTDKPSTEEIMTRFVPDEWFDTWESAWSEIRDIIDEERMNG